MFYVTIINSNDKKMAINKNNKKMATNKKVWKIK